MGADVHFNGEVFQVENGSWFFIRLPAETGDDIRDLVTGPPTGFGSVRVEVTIGSSVWATSVFPDKGSGSFVLPVKKPVRLAEGIEEGDEVAVSLRVLG